jgi:O-antigen ligase
MIAVAVVALSQFRVLHHFSPSERLDQRTVLLKLWEANPLAVPIMVYAIVYLLATAVSVNFQASLWGFSNGHGTATILCAVAFSLLIVAGIRTWAQLERMVTALILGSVPVALYGWVQYLGLDVLDWVAFPRLASPVHSTFAHALYLGSYLAMVIPFTLSRIVIGRYNEQNRPLPYILVLLSQVTCLVLTLARGAWLAFLAGCMLFLMLLAYGERNRTLIIVLVAVLAVGIGHFVLINQEAGAILLPATGDVPRGAWFVGVREGSNQFRIVLWKNTLDLISERWLLGYGPETFALVYSLNYPSYSYPGNPTRDPHNLFLYHLTAVGVAGSVAFLWIVVAFYRITLDAFLRDANAHRKATIAAILSSVTAFLIQAQFNPYEIVLVALFWLVLSLGAVVSRLQGEVPNVEKSKGSGAEPHYVKKTA